jgi:hypothetical protein
MKFLSLAALLLIPPAASAQTSPPPAAAAAAAPTPAAPAPAAPAAPAAAAKFTLDTPIQDIVADAAGKAVLEKDLPGLIGLPQYETFKAISLKQLQAYADGKLTDEMLAKTATDLAAIK